MLFLSPKEYSVTSRGEWGVIGKLSRGEHSVVDYLDSDKLVAHFTGVRQQLAYMSKHMSQPQQHGDSMEASGTAGSGFGGYAEAFDTFWHRPHEVRKFEEKDLRLKGGDEGGIAVTYGQTGDFLDIDRVLAGEPEHFGIMTEGLPRGERVTIVLSGSWVHNAEPEYISYVGQRATRLVDWLESQQVRVRIIAVDSDDETHVETELKRYDEPVDLDQIAVAGHPAWTRHILFRVKEYTPRLGGGYGSSVLFREAMHRFASPSPMADIAGKMPGGHELTDGHLVLVGNQSSTIPTARDAFAEVERQLTELLQTPSAEPTFIKLLTGY